MNSQIAEQNKFLLTLPPLDCLAQGFVSLLDFAQYEISVEEFLFDQNSPVRRLDHWPLQKKIIDQVPHFPLESQQNNKLIIEVGLIKAVHMGLIHLVSYSEYKASLIQLQIEVARVDHPIVKKLCEARSRTHIDATMLKHEELVEKKEDVFSKEEKNEEAEEDKESFLVKKEEKKEYDEFLKEEDQVWDDDDEYNTDQMEEEEERNSQGDEERWNPDTPEITRIL